MNRVFFLVALLVNLVTYMLTAKQAECHVTAK